MTQRFANLISVRPFNLQTSDTSLLEAMARAEGFVFVDRLRCEWINGGNRFDRRGECFLGCYSDGSLAGFGGLNIDRYTDDDGCGRLRHLYIRPEYRSRGMGRRLVEALLGHSRSTFSELRLRAAGPAAAAFYDAIGFARLHGPDATRHWKNA